MLGNAYSMHPTTQFAISRGCSIGEKDLTLKLNSSKQAQAPSFPAPPATLLSLVEGTHEEHQPSMRLEPLPIDNRWRV